MSAIYTPKDVYAYIDVSSSGLRMYTDRYSPYLSPEATRVPRKFTGADLKILAFVVDGVKRQRLTQEQIKAALDAGALDNFEWQVPTGDARPVILPEPTHGAEPPTQDFYLLLDDFRRREQESRQREQVLLAEISRLQNELGKAQGVLEMLKAALG